MKPGLDLKDPAGLQLSGEKIAGRSVDDIKAVVDFKGPVKKIEDFPDEAYARLLKAQLRRAFREAGLENGTRPGLTVHVTLVELAYANGPLADDNPSRLRASIEVMDITGATRAIFYVETRHAARPLPKGGQVVVVPLGFSGRDWQSISRMIPAAAVNITRAIIDMKENDEKSRAKDEVNADAILSSGQFGLRSLTNNDVREALSADANH